jgi:hypothetical protein
MGKQGGQFFISEEAIESIEFVTQVAPAVRVLRRAHLHSRLGGH